MKRFLLPAALSALMIAQVHAESFTISDIRVNGLQRVSAGSVFGALPLNVGEVADDRRLVDSTRALFKTGFFQDIQRRRHHRQFFMAVRRGAPMPRYMLEHRQDAAFLMLENAELAGELGQWRQTAGFGRQREAGGIGQGASTLILEIGRQFDFQFGVLREGAFEAQAGDHGFQFAFSLRTLR